jgi:Heterokaryon incompatibility protein (HET)
MKDIYGHAQKIIIWLGPAEDDSDLAMDRIKCLTEFERRRGRCFPFLGHPFDPKVLGPENRPFSLDSWIAVRKLLHRPWWRRAWIIQESSPPERQGYQTAVWCGHQRIKWVNFFSANFSLFSVMCQPAFVEEEDICNKSIGPLTLLKSKRERPRNYPPLEFIDLLRAVRGFAATDPRDKIYSILAIAVDGDALELHPDYSLPLLELYRHVVVYSIIYCDNLEILCFCARGGTDSQMPFWVPNWSFQAAPFAFPRQTTKQDDRVYRVYNASGDKPTKVGTSTDNKILMVDGFVFDTVCEVSQPKIGERKDIDLAFYQQWLNLALSGDGATYIGDETKFEAF